MSTKNWMLKTENSLKSTLVSSEMHCLTWKCNNKLDWCFSTKATLSSVDFSPHKLGIEVHTP